MELKNVVRTIPDFPKPGILFRDITPILKDPVSLHDAIDQMTRKIVQSPFDLVLGPESRGFIFGMPIAYNLNKGFIPVRKAGKLPFDTVKTSYALEYGEAEIEMHSDAVAAGQRVIIVDDLLATGGTAKAIAEMITSVGGIVTAMVFLIELEGLGGRQVLKDYEIYSILRY